MIFFDSIINHDPEVALSSLMHLILPVVTLTYAILAMIVRTMRSGMVDASTQEYIRTAKAKGVPFKAIVKKHTRRDALIPTITIMGIVMSYLLTGLIVVETIFSYQGLGWLMAESVLHAEIYSIIYSSLLFGVFIVISTLAADVIYAYIDPRIRY
ncbi:MAG TPA: ABC transporter permease [Thermoplasmataceae archaeon]|nr:ABC transporter permease [Thermoplasmataceae archaeon]